MGANESNFMATVIYVMLALLVVLWIRALERGDR